MHVDFRRQLAPKKQSMSAALILMKAAIISETNLYQRLSLTVTFGIPRHEKWWWLRGLKVHSSNSHFLDEGLRLREMQELVQIHITSMGNLSPNLSFWAPV